MIADGRALDFLFGALVIGLIFWGVIGAPVPF
jgi:hypothetical protein